MLEDLTSGVAVEYVTHLYSSGITAVVAMDPNFSCLSGTVTLDKGKGKYSAFENELLINFQRQGNPKLP